MRAVLLIEVEDKIHTLQLSCETQTGEWGELLRRAAESLERIFPKEAAAAETKETAEPEELLTPRELAERLKLAVSTLYKYLGGWREEEGVMRFNERVVRIDWRKFEEAMRAGRIKAPRLEP